MNPGRWSMAIAKRHRAALVAAGAETMPPMIDVTVSLMMLHRRRPDAIDFSLLMSLDDAELIARVGYIHNNIDRRTGEIHGDLFPPALTEQGAHACA